MRTPSVLLVAVLAACSSGTPGATAPAPAAAPVGPTATADCPLVPGSTVLATEFTSTGERADITLTTGCLYWAETDVSGINIQLRPRTSGTQLPYIGRLMSGGAQGGTTWELRATNGGEFQIWATGAPTGRAVKLTVTARGPIKPKSS